MAGFPRQRVGTSHNASWLVVQGEVVLLHLREPACLSTVKAASLSEVREIEVI